MSLNTGWQRRLNRAALFTSLLVGVATGCNSCCTEEPLVEPPDQACSIIECDEGDDFRFGRCDIGGCSVDSDCCPGMRCRSDLNLCFPRLLDSEFECETSADCQDPAQVCATISIGGRDPLPTCIFESCAGDSDCGFGRTCFQGSCVIAPPCSGGCPDGSVCDVSSNSCHELPTVKDGFDASCSAACDGLLVLSQPAVMTGDACCALACECVPQPPIVPTRVGRYARITHTGSAVLVSAYDAEYGDLVVVRHTKDGEQSGIDYVDGVPNEPPTGDPAGARGGVRAPGPNVGTHTSIAVDGGGLARVAYHDVGNNALKVALEGPPGIWTSHIVDAAATSSQGQVGTFTDIRILASGTIVVSYLAHDTLIAGVTGQGTGVKVARSRTPTPRSATDWELIVVDARPIVVVEGARDDAQEMPRGRGLHTALVLDGADAVVAYYDHGDGDLRVARVPAIGTTASISVIDGDGTEGRRDGDVGRFPALGIVGGDLVVVYEDASRHVLRSWRGSRATPGIGGTYGIADQVREPARSGSHFVGAGARMSTTGARPVLVYQDASTLDLRFATLENQGFAPTTVLADGAQGFYSDVVVVDDRAFVVSVTAELDQRGKERSRFRLDVQQLP